MKFLKGLCKGILLLCLVNLISLLVLSFSVKGMLSEAVIETALKGTLKQQIIENIDSSDDGSGTISDDAEVNEKVNQLLENEEIKELINKYFDTTIEGLISDKGMDSVNLEEDVIKFIKDNREYLEKEFDVKITDEDIDKLREQDEYKELTEEYKNMVEEGRESLSPGNKMLLEGFNTFVSKKFRGFMIGAILIILVLIALLDKSLHSWIKTLGISTCTGGGIVLIMSLAVGGMVNMVLKKVGNSVEFTTQSLTMASIVTIVIGAVIIIGYEIIIRMIRKRKENEVSTVS